MDEITIPLGFFLAGIVHIVVTNVVALVYSLHDAEEYLVVFEPTSW